MHLTCAKGKPALLASSESDRWLIVSDVHLGFANVSSYNDEDGLNQAAVLATKLVDMGKQKRCNKLLLLGDIKHSIKSPTPLELKQIDLFFRILNKKFFIWVTLGNHDTGIQDVIGKRANVAGKEGIILEDVLFCHGHSVPSRYLECKTIVMGHVHPHALSGGRVTPVWMIFRSLRKNLKPHRIIIVPHFNDELTLLNYSPGIPQDISPILRNLDMINYKLQLLDLECRTISIENSYSQS
jgi:metallophosphoesterase superfamily enzyme